jgi:branched-chain amino acid transport system substrate-binding protein
MEKQRKVGWKSLSVVGVCLIAMIFSFPEFGKGATTMAEVPIAVVMPMSGPTGSFGQNALRGWEIAVDEVNSAGGIKSLGGAKIKTVLRDTQSTPRIGMAETEKVAQDKSIPIMVGCWGSAVTYPVSQISEQNGLPHLIDMATQTDILRRGFKYVFRLNMDVNRTGERFVELVEDMGKRTGHAAKRVAFISVDDNFGKACVHAVKSALKNTKQEVVEDIYYPLKVTNLDVEVAKLKAAKPDVIYMSNFLNDSVLLAKAFYAQKVDAMAYVSWGGGQGQAEFLDMVGNLANYSFMDSKFDYDMNRPVDKEFGDKLMKRFGIRINHYSTSMYGLVYLIKDVLERAQTIDRVKVRDAIASTNITSGPAMIIPGKFIRFDNNGENMGAADLFAQCIKKEWHTVWPIDWPRKYDPVWPQPKWDERKE